MRDEIEDKLKTFLAGKSVLATEPEVVYLMVELRKMLDHMDEQGDSRFPVIRFYADWIVHIRKDKHSKEAKDLLGNLLGGVTGKDGIAKLIFFIKMNDLLDELAGLLGEKGLSTDFLGDGGMSMADIPSSTFIRTLSGVLKDQPLNLAKAGIGVESIRIVRIGDFGIDVEVIHEDGSPHPFTLALPSVEEIRAMEQRWLEREATA